MTLQQTSTQTDKQRIRQLENVVEEQHNEINGLKLNLEQRDQWASDSEKAKTEAERQRKEAVEMYMELHSKYLVLEREKNEATSIVSRMTEEKQTSELQKERIQTALELSERNVAELTSQNMSLSEQRERENELVDELQREIVSLSELLQIAHLRIQWQEQEFQGELQMLARGTAAGAVAAVPVDPVVNEVVPVQEGTDFAQGTYGLDSFVIGEMVFIGFSSIYSLGI